MNSRGGRPRAVTISPRPLTKEEKKLRELLPIVDDPFRPSESGECEDGPRPCPYVSCKHHLYLDVNPETGSIKLNFPDREVDELAETCAVDVARRGEHILEEVGELLNLTRERVRQVEVRALLKLPKPVLASFDNLLDPDEL